MDGEGCWRDNVFVERLKYEEVYLHAYETVSAAQQGLERYLTFYNQTREEARESRTVWYGVAWLHRSHQVVANQRSEAMKKARRNHGATVKAHVALAALAEQFRVHPTQITEWKQQ
ncbi:MAG: hypothetical protein ABI604_11720, partial [Nitrospirota bacterium]